MNFFLTPGKKNLTSSEIWDLFIPNWNNPEAAFGQYDNATSLEGLTSAPNSAIKKPNWTGMKNSY